MESLRKQIGVVQQDVFLFGGTLRDNIIYGNLNATEEEINYAVDQAQLRTFVDELPEGLDTVVGERGTKIIWWTKSNVFQLRECS